MGTLLLAKEQGLIVQIKPILDDLIAVGKRISPQLYQAFSLLVTPSPSPHWHSPDSVIFLQSFLSIAGNRLHIVFGDQPLKEA